MVEHHGNEPARTTPILEARHIGRCDHRSATRLLDDVSLGIDAGQRIAVVGPTGAGKTLLLRALALLDRLDSGTVLWNGEPIEPRTVPRYRSEVTYLHQQPAIFPGTVEENLRIPFGLQTHGDRRFDEERVLGLLREIGRNADFLRKDGRSLSGGERQITATLRAIQLDPHVMLFDEPTAALDAAAAEAVEHMVRRWQADANRSFLWVTHDRRQVASIADRVLTMRDGRLVGKD